MSQFKKICPSCLEDKPIELFGKRRICNNCRTIKQQESSGKRACDGCGRLLPLVAFKEADGVICRGCTGQGRL
jgi:hypothetical protein